MQKQPLGACPMGSRIDVPKTLPRNHLYRFISQGPERKELAAQKREPLEVGVVWMFSAMQK